MQSAPLPLPLFKKTAPLPVEDNWQCKRSGECCTKPDFVIMTEQEQKVLMGSAERALTIGQLNKIHWQPDQPGFVALLAGPCPLHEFVNGVSTCLVHSVRPYNCRRFACLRPDPKKEPLQIAPLAPVLQYGNVGCSNLRQRLLQSRVARRTFELIQRKARRWADKHGWLPS
jgi:Fe-S-cluster containining protein